MERKSNFKAYSKLGAYLAGTALTTLLLVKAYEYENKPINIVVYELTADAGLNLTDDGKKFSGEMTKQELIDYVKENNISIEEIEKNIEKFSKRNLIDYDFAYDKVVDNNKGVFNK